MNNEKMLLSQLIGDNSIYHSFKIKVDDFYDIESRKIFKAIGDCISQGLTADIVIISQQNESINPFTLSGLTSMPSGNWQYYHDDILKKSHSRKVKTLALQFVDWTNQEDSQTALSYLEKALTELSIDKSKDSIKHINELALEFLDVVGERYKNKGILPGISTGIDKLDNMTLGFRDRMYYLIGARPSQGKSSLLLNMACHAALRVGKKVGYISTESSNLEIITRVYASEGQINSMNLISGSLQNKEFGSLQTTSELLKDKSMYFYYTPGMTLEDVQTQAKRMRRFFKCDIIFVDYLQDIVLPGRDTTTDKTSNKSRAMKVLCEELEIPIVAAAQLGRASDGRRPRLSDFSDSSQLEKDADGGFLIYHRQTNTDYPNDKPEYESEILVEKVRDGITGDVKVLFKREYTKFIEKPNQED